MKRFALAVVLSVSITHFAIAQHHDGGSASSSSSSSSGSSSPGSSGGGYSGGGGGYSGGSSHSSGGSSSGGGYSGGGGGSSHSSASSGGSSGGSHSAGSASSHSGSSGFSPSHAGSGGNPHSGGNASAHSNLRSSTSSVDHLAGAASQPSVNRWNSSSSAGLQSGRHLPGSDFLMKQVPSGQQWMYRSFVLDLPVRPDLNKGLGKHEFDSKLQGVGLEPSKSAYREKLVVVGGMSQQFHRPNWIARIFGAKTPAPKQASPQFRPCLAKECKPLPVPPKPCTGPKCPTPTPTPTPTPVTGVCTSGYDSNGYCMPWGYVDRCSRYGDSCYLRFARINVDYCWRILQEIRRQQGLQNQLRMKQQSVCSTTPQNQECAQAAQDLQNLAATIGQLQRQYQLCRTATAWVPVDWDSPDPSLLSAEWPTTTWQYFWPPFF